MEQGLLAASPPQFRRASEPAVSGRRIAATTSTLTLDCAVDLVRGLPVGRLQPHYGRA